MTAELQIHLLDMLRSVALFEAVALSVIAGFGAYDAWVEPFPRDIKIGMLGRWIGRTLIHAFCALFVLERFGDQHLNWVTPFVLLGQTLLLVSIWVTRHQLFLMGGEFLLTDGRKNGRASRDTDPAT